MNIHIGCVYMSTGEETEAVGYSTEFVTHTTCALLPPSHTYGNNSLIFKWLTLILQQWCQQSLTLRDIYSDICL